MRYLTLFSFLLLLASCASAPPEGGTSLVSLTPVPLSVALKDISDTTDTAWKTNPAGSIAVVDFQDSNQTTKDQSKTFENYFVDTLLTTISQDHPSLPMVERKQVLQIYKERTFSNTGILSDSDVKNLGALTGASLVLTGTYFIFPKEVEVHARLVSVANGTILGSRVIRIRVDSAISSLLTGVSAGNVASPELQKLQARLRQLDDQMSVAKVNDNNSRVAGLVWLGLGVLGGGVAAYSWYEGSQAYANYQSATDFGKIASYKSTAQTYTNVMLYSGISAALSLLISPFCLFSHQATDVQSKIDAVMLQIQQTEQGAL